MRRTLRLGVLALVMALALLAWVRTAPRVTPPAQPSLVRLGPGDLAPVRQWFNSRTDQARLLLLLSPT